MRALAQKLNFTWQIHYPLEGEYGSVKPDGSEDGMVGEARKLNNLIFLYSNIDLIKYFVFKISDEYISFFAISGFNIHEIFLSNSRHHFSKLV